MDRREAPEGALGTFSEDWEAGQISACAGFVKLTEISSTDSRQGFNRRQQDQEGIRLARGTQPRGADASPFGRSAARWHRSHRGVDPDRPGARPPSRNGRSREWVPRDPPRGNPGERSTSEGARAGSTLPSSPRGPAPAPPGPDPPLRPRLLSLLQVGEEAVLPDRHLEDDQIPQARHAGRGRKERSIGLILAHAHDACIGRSDDRRSRRFRALGTHEAQGPALFGVEHGRPVRECAFTAPEDAPLPVDGQPEVDRARENPRARTERGTRRAPRRAPPPGPSMALVAAFD